MSRALIAGVAAVFVLAIIAGASLFTVGQTEQVLVTQFGQPIRVINQPGLNAKLPFVQTVIEFDKRLLDFSTDREEIILGDQRRLTVDSFTRYPHHRPAALLPGGRRQRGGDPRAAELGRDIIAAAGPWQRAAAQGAVVGPAADHGADQRQVSSEMQGFGIAIEDVRLRRADLPEENTQAILNRMKSERERVASSCARKAQRRPRASAPTPSATAPCCWPRRGAPPTAARRGRGRGDQDLRRRLRAGSRFLRHLPDAAGLSRGVRQRPVPPGADAERRLPAAAAGDAASIVRQASAPARPLLAGPGRAEYIAVT